MKKKILVLSSTFPRWKNDHEPPFVYELAKRYTNDYDVHVLAPHTSNSPCKELMSGLSIHHFRYAPASMEKLAYNGGISSNLSRHPMRYFLVPPFILAELFYALHLVRKEKIDLIHAHWIIPQGLVAILVAALTKSKPVILVTAHGADVYTQKSRLLSSIKKFILSRATKITVVSQGMADSLKQLYSNLDVEIIPMGTDLQNTFIPKAINNTDKQLIFIGRLVEKKGVKYLIKGYSKLLKNYPSLKLVIIGHGPEKDYLLKHSHSLGLTEKLTFIEGLPQASLPAYLQQSIIAIFPFIQAKNGDQEGFGLVMVEAMGCACATIATDMPAVHDIIQNNETGLLVQEKDADSIFSAVSTLLDKPEFREKLADNGRSHVLKHFDWAVISQSYLRLISDLLSNATADTNKQHK